MALKKELAALFNILQYKISNLPPKFRPRASSDLDSIFRNYESLESEADLQAVKKKAENKLVILEMSQDSSPKPEPMAGVKTFIVKDGKVQEGQSEKKFVPEYSNWYAGNVDPQDLRRHKDLLDRQHFSGPFWEGRPRNPSILEEENPRYEKVDPEEHPPESLREEKENAFDPVKR